MAAPSAHSSHPSAYRWPGNLGTSLDLEDLLDPVLADPLSGVAVRGIPEIPGSEK